MVIIAGKSSRCPAYLAPCSAHIPPGSTSIASKTAKRLRSHGVVYLSIVHVDGIMRQPSSISRPPHRTFAPPCPIPPPFSSQYVSHHHATGARLPFRMYIKLRSRFAGALQKHTLRE